MSQHSETDKAIADVIEAGGVLGPEHRRLVEVCRSLEQRFIFAQNHANAISTLHGDAWNLARELFTLLKDGHALTAAETAALDRRIYGEGRPVPPHRSGGGNPPPKTYSSEKP